MADISDGLRAAITAAGNSKKLAAAIGVTAQAVSQWRDVPIGRVLAIEAAFGVPRQKLRPDYYPPARPTQRRVAA
jgi:DNA-binding transcriptional regulator YdaS (Cro superfamily)